MLWRTTIEGLGHSSPVIWGDRVFVTTAMSELTEQSVDDGGRGWIAGVEEAVEHRWELHAYRLADGELLWKRTAKTGVPSSQRHWKASQANPSCATDGKVVMASFGPEGLYAYDLDGEPPKPIYVVRAGAASGDVTPPEGGGNESVVWSRQTDGVYGVTPLLYRGVLYMLRNNGVLTAWDPATGKEHFKERLGGRFTASPVAADGRVYFTAEDGTVTVIEAGRKLGVLTRNQLGATTLATPAISDGKMVLRTVHGLIGVGYRQTKAEAAP